jgi:two-component system cell cycle response regulator DivK
MPANILIVDDTPANLQLIAYLLENSGFNVLDAETGEEAIERAREWNPDLVVLDIQLPDIDGYETLNRLRSDPAFADTPVIAVTAFAMANDRRRAEEAGFDGFVTKPIDPYTFVTDISSCLATHFRG